MNNRVLKVSFYANLCCENIANKTTTLYIKAGILSSRNCKIQADENAGYIKSKFNLYNNQQLDINSNK
ncbi:MAG: hypothetical protein GX783_06160 [Clostridiales bacterium]|nr:hypothetical protein [Clostridiales bacterium]